MHSKLSTKRSGDFLFSTGLHQGGGRESAMQQLQRMQVSTWGSTFHALRREISSTGSQRFVGSAVPQKLGNFALRDRYFIPKVTSSFRAYSASNDLKEKDKPRSRAQLFSQARLQSLLTGLSAASDRLSAGYSRLAQTSYGRLMRLDKPVGTHLLFLPGAWGISMGVSSPLDFLSLTALFYGGAILLRGAGCTINDIWDADIDKRVERTKSRPIANGEISTTSAFVFLGAQLLGGLGILTQLNSESFLLGTASVLPVFFYPLAKRKMAYPQAVLGLTFNWGALLGYCAATGTVGAPAFLLYGAGWCWTMVYDTIYAHQDKGDDERLGVQSTALTFGDRTKPALAALTAAKLALLSGAGFAADLSLPYFIGVTASAIHLGHQVYSTDLSDPAQCQKAFARNEITGAIAWASIVAGRLF